MQDKKGWVFTPAPIIYACRYSFAMSTHVCNVLLTDFLKKSESEQCVWSAQCIDRQASTPDIVKTWVFISHNVRWWSFLDYVVYCNTLVSITTAFLELEKAICTVATLLPMFTMITPGPHSHSKHSKTRHTKSNLKVNCEKNDFDN